MPRTVSSLRQLSLGKGWSTNTVNTVTFREPGLFTLGRYQFTAFFAGKRTLRIVRRDLHNNHLTTFDLPGSYNVRDAHDCISLGHDGDGYLHLAYDHHNSRLRYRQSKVPLSINAWTDEVPMTGKYEEYLSYPGFVFFPKSGTLLFLFRDGSSARGLMRIKEWSARRKKWTDRPMAVLSGADQRPWTSAPYWNHPIVGKDGSLHLSFVWRAGPIGDKKLVNNIGIDYARSPDRGKNWYSMRDQPFELPITQVNSETIWPTSPGSNLINQTSMALDSKGNPHIVFYADDPDGIPQYQHLRFDGRAWRQRTISVRRKRFALRGGGTLRLPISRPEILIDGADQVYVIYRGDLTGDLMAVQRLLPPAYCADPADVRILWHEPLGFAEPVVDRSRWQRHGVLSMLIQKNNQPAHDRCGRSEYQPVFIADWNLARLWEPPKGACKPA